MQPINELHIYTDGCSRGNPGQASIAFIICNNKDAVLYEHNECIGKATNNIAEYTAIIRALERAIDYCRKKILLYSDSELVIRQINGRYKVKKQHLLNLFKTVKDKEKAFESVTYLHKPRSHQKIQQVDRLANEALDEN